MMSGYKRRCDDSLNFTKETKTMDTMKLTMMKVQSTMVASVGYDNETETLFLEFHSKDGAPAVIYRYPFVSANSFAEIVTSPSIGRALQPIIKSTQRDWIKENVTDRYSIVYSEPFSV